MENQALYETADKKIFYQDFVNALKDAGVNKGDVVFVHSDTANFGKLATFDRHLLMNSLIDSIKESVGEEGTIVMPTFTYSFDKKEVFDVENTKSTVGVLTEHFRKMPDVSRTIHPSHSVAIWGKHKDELLKISKNTFDENSIFGKVLKMNGKFVFFGAPLSISCTFIHYIEQVHGVPYRYMGKYIGKIKEGDKKYEDGFTFYYKYSFFFTSMERLEKYLLDKGLLKEVNIGDGKIQVVNSNDLLMEGLKLLDKDVYFFLKKNPFIFRLFNTCIHPFLEYAPWFAKILDKCTEKVLRRKQLRKKP